MTLNNVGLMKRIYDALMVHFVIHVHCIENMDRRFLQK